MRRLLAGSVVVTVALVASSALRAGAAPASTADNQNGEAKRSPTQVIADAKDALSTASSMTIVGSGPYKGKKLTFDLVATRGHGGGGTLAINGNLDFVVAAPYIYVRGDATFWKKNAGADQAGADLLAGKWLRTSTKNKQLNGIAQFADLKYWIKNLYTGGGKLTEGSQRTFHGAPVVAIRDASGTTPGTLLVAATGKPFPVAFLSDKGGPNTELVLGSYNSATPPAAPAGAVNLPNS